MFYITCCIYLYSYSQLQLLCYIKYLLPLIDTRLMKGLHMCGSTGGNDHDSSTCKPEGIFIWGLAPREKKYQYFDLVIYFSNSGGFFLLPRLLLKVGDPNGYHCCRNYISEYICWSASEPSTHILRPRILTPSNWSFT